MASTNGDLLKRAVVSLERKWQASQQDVAKLEARVRELQQEAQELPAVRCSLAEALAAHKELEQARDRLQHQMAQMQKEKDAIQRQFEGVQEALRAAEVAQEHEAGQAAQWRAECEALQLGEARARGQAEVLQQQMQQLEEANVSLRQDNQQHAARLKEAYQREGELLVEVADLQARVRQLEHSRSCSSSPSRAVVPAPPCDDPPRLAHGSLEQTLFLAAAQQLTQGFMGRVDQAESSAAQLELQMMQMKGKVEHLQQQAEDLRAALQAAEAQNRVEREARQALLASNLRLQEALVVRVQEQGLDQTEAHGRHVNDMAEPSARSAAAAARTAAGGASLRQREQQRKQADVRQQATRPLATAAARECRRSVTSTAGSRLSSTSSERPSSWGSEHEEIAAWQGGGQRLPAARRGSDQRPAERWGSKHAVHAGKAGIGQPASRGSTPIRQQNLQQRAPRQQQLEQEQQQLEEEQQELQQQRQQEQQQASMASRQAAIDAALNLSLGHRQLQEKHRAVAAELRHVANCLTAAPTSEQLALLRRHVELQRELHDVSQQLGDTVVQLTALKHAGLLA